MEQAGSQHSGPGKQSVHSSGTGQVARVRVVVVMANTQQDRCKVSERTIEYNTDRVVVRGGAPWHTLSSEFVCQVRLTLHPGSHSTPGLPAKTSTCHEVRGVCQVTSFLSTWGGTPKHTLSSEIMCQVRLTLLPGSHSTPGLPVR